MSEDKRPDLKLIKPNNDPVDSESTEEMTAGEMLSDSVRRLRLYAIQTIEAYAMGQGEKYERIASALGWAPNLGTLEELIQVVHELEKKRGVK